MLRGRRLGLVVIIDGDRASERSGNFVDFCSREGVGALREWKVDLFSVTLGDDAGIEPGPRDYRCRHFAPVKSLKAHLIFFALRPRRYISTLLTLVKVPHSRSKSRRATLGVFDFAVRCAMKLKRCRFHELHGAIEDRSGEVALIAGMFLEKPYSLSTVASADAQIEEVLLREKILEARYIAAWRRGGRKAIASRIGEETASLVAEPAETSVEGTGEPGNGDKTGQAATAIPFLEMAELYWPDYFTRGGRASHPLHAAFEIDQLHTYWLSIAWAPHSRRCEMISREFRTRHYLVHFLGFKAPLHAPFKYVLQAIRTFYILLFERPNAVHVQNPPFFCGLTVYLYTLISGAVFVLDHHSAAFAKRWNFGLPLTRFLARQAISNIVTNRHWSGIVRSWGAHALIMGDAFLALPEGDPYPVRDGFGICYICTFSPDEPVKEVIQAAADLPDVNFYVTGDPDQLSKFWKGALPFNVILTGFLPENKYTGLIRSVDGLMSLTTRDFTLQQGGCEAVAIGKPLITSDWPYLHEFFPDGTIYVDSTRESIREGIEEMRREAAKLEPKMCVFREKGRRDWEIQFVRLFNMVAKARS